VGKRDPRISSQIKDLRKRLGVKQRGLAALVGVTQPSVSQWEVGDSEPKVPSYSKLAELSPDDALAKYFLERIAKLSPGLRDVIDRAAQKKEVRPARPRRVGRVEVAQVPLLNDAAAAGVPRIIRDEEIDRWLAFPSEWLPHAESTRCLKVTGDSMSPVLEEGSVVVIDTQEREAGALIGKMVAAQDSEGAVTIKWLRKVGQEYILMAEHTSLRHNPIIMRPGWKIVGRVLFWVGGLA
jgi:SOS-response transcriptional repressor LexA